MITSSSEGAIHAAMPIQKPKSFFANAIGSETNGCLLVAFKNVPALLRFLVGHGRVPSIGAFPYSGPATLGLKGVSD